MFGYNVPEVLIIIGVTFVLLPFLFSGVLAWRRGKDVLMALILTVMFSWFVVFALFLLPEHQFKTIYGEVEECK